MLPYLRVMMVIDGVKWRHWKRILLMYVAHFPMIIRIVLTFFFSFWQIRSIALSQKGDLMAVGSSDSSISLWSVPPRGQQWATSPLRTLTGHTNSVRTLSYYHYRVYNRMAIGDSLWLTIVFLLGNGCRIYMWWRAFNQWLIWQLHSHLAHFRWRANWHF